MIRHLHDIDEDDPLPIPGPKQEDPQEDDPEKDWVQVEGAPYGVQRNVRTGKYRNLYGAR